MKKCPYCAEEIQDDAIFCRYCKQDFFEPKEETSEHHKKTPKTLLIVFIGLCILISIICIVSISIRYIDWGDFNSSVSIPTNTPKPNQDICDWYILVQPIRAKRISELNEFTQWIQNRDINSLNEVEINKFVDLLVNYQPYQEEFVIAWNELGPHPNAIVFWEKELESIELRIEAINDMEQGLNNYDADQYINGWNLFVESQVPGREAEAAMMEIGLKCNK